MLRRKGERFNPYGDWEDQDAVYELLEDARVEYDQPYSASCVFDLWANDCPPGEVRKLRVFESMFAPLPRTGRLAP